MPPPWPPCRPVFLGDDLYCCHPFCQLLSDNDADWILVCKPSSHTCLHDFLHESLYHSSGWLRVRDSKGRIVEHRYRWQCDVPVRDGKGAVTGTWSEFEIRRRKPGRPAPERTYCNTFFTSLEVTKDNAGEIARAGRARWKIENEGFNCLTNHGYNLKHNFGHGKAGLANLLAALNLLAFAFHTVLDSLRGLWRKLRTLLVTRRDFFEHLRVATRLLLFEDWTALLETLLKKRRVPALPPRPA